jgi:hypothetical protein
VKKQAVESNKKAANKKMPDIKTRLAAVEIANRTEFAVAGYQRSSSGARFYKI